MTDTTKPYTLQKFHDQVRGFKINYLGLPPASVLMHPEQADQLQRELWETGRMDMSANPFSIMGITIYRSWDVPVNEVILIGKYDQLRLA